LPAFVAHVDLAFRVLADQDDGKAGLHAGLTKAADGLGICTLRKKLEIRPKWGRCLIRYMEALDR
jgi:hypothetical protein